MPPYFRFLTIMAIHTFLAERVDVAVFEVGIGGQYDCTNVIRSPVVCGVTSLGMDHMPLLGNTIESIAWHKAGIFKTGVPAVTAPQKPAALRVLEQRSREKQSPLYTAPVIEAYSHGEQVQLGLDGKFQRINAALALQLAHIWMHNHNKTNDERKWTAMGEQTTCLETFPIPSQSLLGLKECIWLGRDQILRYPDVTFYLDGAHTLESIEQCVEWFRACAHSEQRDIQKDVAKVLMFNLTGNRDFTPFIPLLKECEFDFVIFCPNTHFHGNTALDLTLISANTHTVLKHCHEMRISWENYQPVDKTDQSDTVVTANKAHQPVVKSSLDYRNCEPNGVVVSRSAVMQSISESMSWLCQGRQCAPQFGQGRQYGAHSYKGASRVPSRVSNAAHIQLLVTGSMHLVGSILGYIDPKIVDQEQLPYGSSITQ